MAKELALYTFIDAFGYEIYQQHPYFLEDIIEEAKPLQSVLGFTNTCLPSILSGKYPQEHGEASPFFYSDPSPFGWMMKYLSYLPKWLDYSKVRSMLSSMVKHLHHYRGNFQLYAIPFDKLIYFDVTQKQDYFVSNGPFETIFDACVKHQINYHCSDWRQSETENINTMHTKVQEAKIRFGWLHLPTLDEIMHTHGTQSDQTTQKIQWLDAQIRGIYNEALKHYDKVSLYILSDQGMYDVTQRVDLINEIESLELIYGQDYVAMYEATMARFWFKTAEAKEKITQKLKTIGSGDILDDRELKKMKSYFKDGRFGELIFLMQPSIMIHPNYFENKPMNGMHGYHPNASGSNALLLSNQTIPHDVTSITDIRRTMEYELRASL